MKPHFSCSISSSKLLFAAKGWDQRWDQWDPSDDIAIETAGLTEEHGLQMEVGPMHSIMNIQLALSCELT